MCLGALNVWGSITSIQSGARLLFASCALR